MDQKEWEENYRSRPADSGPEVAALLQTHAGLINGGRALDIAMGVGQNTVFLASRGCDATGVDRSPEAVMQARSLASKHGVAITAVEADMLAYTMPESSFDIISNFYFLERSLVPGIKHSLKKNGLIFFETYTLDQPRFGHPRNPDFLLKPNELLGWFLDFFIIFYHERNEPDKAVASLIAQKL